MDIDRFRQLAAAYGADIRRWPAPEREQFGPCAATPDGEQALAEARVLDEFLDGLQTRRDDPLRAARILRSARAERRQRRMRAWLTTAYAASLVLGFALGFTQPTGSDDDSDYQELMLGSATMEDFL